MFGRWHAARSRRRARRKVRAIAATTSMMWLTEDGLPPSAPARGRCHICGVGRPTVRDPYSGTPCCDHCGAPVDQIPGMPPINGARACDDHLTGECADYGCRSVGHPDVDARERERAML